MAAHKGHKKSGGRQKGTPNKFKMAPLRQQFANSIYEWSTADQLIAFYLKAKDERVKFQILELIVRYTNVIPTTEIPYEEEDETDASLEDLMKAASS